MSLAPAPRRRQYPRRGDKCASNPQWANEPLELKRMLVCWACLPLVDHSLRPRSKPCVNPRPWTKDARVRRKQPKQSDETRPTLADFLLLFSHRPFLLTVVLLLFSASVRRKNGCMSSRAT